MNKRVLYSDNGTIVDFSSKMDEYSNGSKTFQYKTGDFLYIGSRLPFNHTFFKLSVPNTIACKLTAKYWDQSTWNDFVETIDETEGFTQSGILTFVPDKNKPWQMSSTNYDSQKVMGLETVTIYDLYWIRISFDQDFVGPEVDPSTMPATYQDVALQWLGNLFASDFDLTGEFPDFGKQNLKNAYTQGKVDWEEQRAIASKQLCEDLINQGVVDDSNQILNRSDYTLACVQKTAELIFAALGDDYADDRKFAREEYKQRMKKRVQKVDANKNGREDVAERTNTTGWLSR